MFEKRYAIQRQIRGLKNFPLREQFWSPWIYAGTNHQHMTNTGPFRFKISAIAAMKEVHAEYDRDTSYLGAHRVLDTRTGKVVGYIS